MTLQPVATPRSSVPIACSLNAGAAGARESEWRALLSRALIGSACARGGARVELRALPGVRHELERLVAAERKCCPFMTMSLEATDEAIVVLTVTTPELGATILAQLFAEGAGGQDRGGLGLNER
jgi:hypothetical protein